MNRIICFLRTAILANQLKDIFHAVYSSVALRRCFELIENFLTFTILEKWKAKSNSCCFLIGSRRVIQGHWTECARRSSLVSKPTSKGVVTLLFQMGCFSIVTHYMYSVPVTSYFTPQRQGCAGPPRYRENSRRTGILLQHANLYKKPVYKVLGTRLTNELGLTPWVF